MDTIVILAAGYEESSQTPHALLFHEKVYMVNYYLALCNGVFPKSDMITVLGYKADKVASSIKHKTRLIYNERYEETSSSRSAYLGLQAARGDNALILYVNEFADTSTLELFSRESSNCTLKDVKSLNNTHKVGFSHRDEFVLNFSYGLDITWLPIIHLNKKGIKAFKKYHRWNELMYETLNSMIDNGIEIRLIKNDT